MALLNLDAINPDTDPKEIVRILSYRHNEEGDYTTYLLEIRIGDVRWTVERRYREFAAFNKEKFAKMLDAKTLLPGKKLVGNKDDAFLERRRNDLEQYIRIVLQLDIFMQKKLNKHSLSPKLAQFLHFSNYEVHGIVEDLSRRVYVGGDRWLEKASIKPKAVQFSPIELFAVSERLKLPTNFCDSKNAEYDLGNLVDFLHRVTYLKIRGSKGCVGTSNIVDNQLSFSLYFCKSLLSLWITDCDPSKFEGVRFCRETVTTLVIHYSLNKICDFVSESPFSNSGEPCNSSETCSDCWSSVVDMDLSFNELTEIDQAIRLFPEVQKLNLSCNRLQDIGTHLQFCVHLTVLNVSNNGIESLDKWHTKLGNVKQLYLAGNSVRCLQGLSKLYSLEYLDVQDNALMQTSDIWCIGALPCLSTVHLEGNPIQSSVEYRTRVLQAFSDRASEIFLDGEKATQQELDTVGVRLAIHKAKKEREMLLEKTREQISEKLRFLGDEVLGDHEKIQEHDIQAHSSHIT